MNKLLLIILPFIVFICISCGSNVEFNCEQVVKTTSEASVDSVKVYLDNSVSMRGLICHETQFNAQMSEFINFIGHPQYYDNQVNYYTLSDNISQYSSKDEFLAIFHKYKFNAIDGKGTPLLDMLGEVIRQNKKGQVSIVVTDAIFSGKETNELQQKTTTIIADAAKNKKVSMKIYQLTSDFHHKNKSLYYTKDKALQGKERVFEDFAYYILIIGEYDVINTFDRDLYQTRYAEQGELFEFNIDTLLLEGHHTLYYKKKKNVLVRPILDKKTRTKVMTLEIERGEDEVKFSVLLNTRRKLEDYEDTKDFEYEILLNNEPLENFDIPILHRTLNEKNINRIYSNTQQSKVDLECFQYLMELKFPSKQLPFLKGDNELTIVKKKKRPDFSRINNDDDTDGPTEAQTYGIKYFFNGIEDGFNPKKEETTVYKISIPFKVKKN